MAHPPDSPSIPSSQTRSILFLIVVGLFGVGLGFLANILDPFIYSEKVRLLAPPWLKNTALSFITIMALIMALITQPIVGRWSDRTHNRRGRRAPYLTGGVIGVSFSLAMIVMADNFWLLMMAAMLTSVFANTVQSPWQALIPDQVPEAQRGKAAGTKTLLELIGITAGVAVVGPALARGFLWAAPLTAMAIFWGILLVTLHALRQSSYQQTNPPDGRVDNARFQPQGKPTIKTLLDKLLSVYSLIRAAPGLSGWMLNRFLFWSAAIAVRTFILNYMEDVLALPSAEAQVLSSRIFLLLGIGVLFLALPAGAVADRIGRQPLLVIAGLMAAGGTVLLIFLRDHNQLFIAGGMIAVGAGIFASSSWALATDLAPKTQGALYLGLANGATIVGSMGGRMGGPLIDGINQLTGTVTIGYLLVFGIATLFFVGSSAVVLKIPGISTELEVIQ